MAQQLRCWIARLAVRSNGERHLLLEPVNGADADTQLLRRGVDAWGNITGIGRAKLVDMVKERIARTAEHICIVWSKADSTYLDACGSERSGTKPTVGEAMVVDDGTASAKMLIQSVAYVTLPSGTGPSHLCSITSLRGTVWTLRPHLPGSATAARRLPRRAVCRGSATASHEPGWHLAEPAPLSWRTCREGRPRPSVLGTSAADPERPFDHVARSMARAAGGGLPGSGGVRASSRCARRHLESDPSRTSGSGPRRREGGRLSPTGMVSDYPFPDCPMLTDKTKAGGV